VQGGAAVELVLVMMVFRMLDLNSNVHHFHVLQHVLDLSKSLEGVLGGNMCAACVLSVGKSPDVEIVDTFNTFDALNSFLNIVIFHVRRSGLHEGEDTALDCGI